MYSVCLERHGKRRTKRPGIRNGYGDGMSCERCPCPDVCLQWPVFCEWAKGGDPVQVRHICARSGGVAPPSYPPVATQVLSFLGALKVFVKAGCPVASRAERARRRAICERCPAFNAAAKRCMKCGCSTSIKPWLLTAECPEKRWESV